MEFSDNAVLGTSCIVFTQKHRIAHAQFRSYIELNALHKTAGLLH